MGKRLWYFALFTLHKCWDHRSTIPLLNVPQWSGLWFGLRPPLTHPGMKTTLVLRGAKTVERLLEDGVRRELAVKTVRFFRGRNLCVSCKRTLGLGRGRWMEFAVANVMSTQPSHTRWEGYLYSTVGKGERSCLWALTYRHGERRLYHFSLRTPLVTLRSKSACGNIQFIGLHTPCRICEIFIILIIKSYIYVWNNIALKLVDIFTYRPQDKINKNVIKYEIN